MSKNEKSKPVEVKNHEKSKQSKPVEVKNQSTARNKEVIELITAKLNSLNQKSATTSNTLQVLLNVLDGKYIPKNDKRNIVFDYLLELDPKDSEDSFIINDLIRSVQVSKNKLARTSTITFKQDVTQTIINAAMESDFIIEQMYRNTQGNPNGVRIIPTKESFEKTLNIHKDFSLIANELQNKVYSYNAQGLGTRRSINNLITNVINSNHEEIKTFVLNGEDNNTIIPKLKIPNLNSAELKENDSKKYLDITLNVSELSKDNKELLASTIHSIKKEAVEQDKDKIIKKIENGSSIEEIISSYKFSSGYLNSLVHNLGRTVVSSKIEDIKKLISSGKNIEEIATILKINNKLLEKHKKMFIKTEE